VIGPLAPVTYYALLVPLRLEMQTATFFVGKVHSERKYIHFTTTFDSVKYTTIQPN